jgi:hypothetical protein
VRRVKLAWMRKSRRPELLRQTRVQALLWEMRSERPGLGGARDALKASQRLIPAVPLTVQQATLVQVDGSYTLDAAGTR